MASDIEIIKKRVRFEMALGECFDELKLEHEIEFPVRVRKIKQVCVEVKDVVAQADEGKICVEGKLNKKYTWVADCDGKYQGVYYEAGGIYDLLVEESFIHYMPLAGLLPSADVRAEVRIKKLEEPTKSLSGDSLPDLWKQCVVLESFARAMLPVEADVVTDIYAPGQDLKIEKATCGLEDLIANWEDEVKLVADIDFSRPVSRIISVQTRLTDVQSEIQTGKICITGLLHKRIYYAEQDTNRLYETSVEESWSKEFEMPGLKPGMQALADVSVVSCEVKLKPEDNQKARQTAIIKVKCKVVEDIVLNYVKDVSGTGCQVIKGKLECNDLVGYGCAEVIVKNDICLDQPVKKILSKDALVYFDYKKSKADYCKVTVVGELYKNICYIDLCEDAVWEKCLLEPFETTIDIPDAEEGMKLRLAGKIKRIDIDCPEYPKDCCYDTFLSQNYPLKQVAVVEVLAKVFSPKELEVVTDLICESKPSPTPCPTLPPCPTTPHPSPPPCPTKPPQPKPTPTVWPTKKPDDCIPGQPGQPSMRFYIIQEGDTLYKLAQRYGTTVEAIMALNPGIDPYNLQIGQVIRIPCGVPGAKG